MQILETDRLILRRFLRTDLEDLVSLYRDPDIRRFFPEGTLTYEETKEELEWFLHGHSEQPELGLWATIHKESDRFIGRCGLLPWTIDGRAEVEVAYLLDKAYWGQGLATEAALGIRTYAFDRLHLSRLVCLIDPRNEKSANVAKRIGMSFERASEDDKGPFHLYSCERGAR